MEGSVGLYDYPLRGPPLRSGNARYYSPVLARFISADTIVPDPANPQALNRYAYVLNNPLRYTDPTGHSEKDPFKRFLCDWAPQLCQPSTPPLLNEQQAGQALSAQQAPVMLNNGAQVPLFAAKREGEGEGKGGGIGGLIGSLLRLLGGGGAGKAAQELSKDGDPTNEVRDVVQTTQNLSRQLTARELGLQGQVQEFRASITVAGSKATVYVDMIRGDIQKPFEALSRLKQIAQSYGADVLRVEASIANERLYKVLKQRYDLITEGGRDFFEISLK